MSENGKIKNRVQGITNFLESKEFDLKEDIIRITRDYLHEPDDYTLNEIRKKIHQLDFVQNYCGDDYIVWDWAEEYYNEEYYEEEENEQISKEIE